MNVLEILKFSIYPSRHIWKIYEKLEGDCPVPSRALIATLAGTDPGSKNIIDGPRDKRTLGEVDGARSLWATTLNPILTLRF